MDNQTEFITNANQVIVVETLGEQRFVSVQRRTANSSPWTLVKTYPNYQGYQIPGLISKLRMEFNVSSANVFNSIGGKWTNFYARNSCTSAGENGTSTSNSN